MTMAAALSFAGCGKDDEGNDEPYPPYPYDPSYPYDPNPGSGGGGTGGNEPGGGGTGGGTEPGGGGTGGGTTTSKPGVPTGLTASPEGPSSAPYAMLRWNNVSGATSYLIYRSSSPGSSYSKIGTSTTYAYTDQSVTYGKTYYYKVKASNSYGTSDFSNYAECVFADRRKPAPVNYGNCTVSGYTMTLRWSVPSHATYGKPTSFILRIYNPYSQQYFDAQTLSASATSVSFNFSNYIDGQGYVKAGIVSVNENGTATPGSRIYDTKNKRWLN